MKVLFFGDIVGKIGREALKIVLPKLKKELKPDLVLANSENLAHGTGITQKTVEEIIKAGVNFLTSGNHFADKKGFEGLLKGKDFKILRPANYPPLVPGQGFVELEVKGKRVYLINLNGRVFLREDFDCPFRKFDELKELLKFNKNDIIIIDFHGEATSEKNAFGWYVDGRASAVLGSHTHVPTCDLKILPKGTAYISDIGMVGAKDSVIGLKKEEIIQGFLSQLPQKFEIPEKGIAQVNAIYLEINSKAGKALKIKRVDRETEITNNK